MKWDKLFLSKNWIDKYLEDNTDVKEAPEIINLKDNEKFKDNDGTILEIETRGCREYDNCFFKVSDVAKGFGIIRLQDVIVDKKKGYNENIHYVYFSCTYNANDKIIVSKKLFLTYAGFSRVIEVSRIPIGPITKNIMKKWLEQFSGRTLSNYKITLPTPIEIKCGYTYVITCKGNNYCKIGFWKSTIVALKSRYVTYYGNKLKLHYVTSYDAKKLEHKTHIKFDKYRISNELFDKKYLQKYIDFLNKYDDKIVIENYKKINESNELIINANVNDDMITEYIQTIEELNNRIRLLEKKLKNK